MNNLFSKFLRAMLGLFATVPVISAREPSPMPKEFSSFIGGFNGTSYRLELHRGVLTYTTSGGGQSNAKRTDVTPSAVQWREFRQALDGLNVWQWRAEYPNDSTRDGTQWSLNITFENRIIKSHGSNCYPDSSGKPNGKPEPTKEFQSYLDAVQKLIGGKTFQ